MSPSSYHSDVYLSVVAPAYNEAGNLAQLVEEISATTSGMGRAAETIIVNDGSTDETTDVLRRLMARFPRLRVLDMKERSGQTAALDAGLRVAKGQFIATLDADLQNDPADLPAMLERLEARRCDMVNGWRRRRQDPWIRRVSTRVANAVRNKLTGEDIRDSACGMKVFRRECLTPLRLFRGMHRFLPTLVKLDGFRVLEMPVSHRSRVAGEAKYGIANRLFRALRDTFAVRWMQSRNLRYECEEWERSHVTDIMRQP